MQSILSRSYLQRAAWVLLLLCICARGQDATQDPPVTGNDPDTPPAVIIENSLTVPTEVTVSSSSYPDASSPAEVSSGASPPLGPPPPGQSPSNNNNNGNGNGNGNQPAPPYPQTTSRRPHRGQTTTFADHFEESVEQGPDRQNTSRDDPPTNPPSPSSYNSQYEPKTPPYPRYPFSGDTHKIIVKFPGNFTLLIQRDPRNEQTMRSLVNILTTYPFNFTREAIKDVKVTCGDKDEIVVAIIFDESQKASKAWKQMTSEGTALSVTLNDETLTAVPIESPEIASTSYPTSSMSSSSITGIVIGCAVFVFAVLVVLSFNQRLLPGTTPPFTLQKMMYPPSQADVFANITPLQAAVLREDVSGLRKLLDLPLAVDGDKAGQVTTVFPDLDAAIPLQPQAPFGGVATSTSLSGLNGVSSGLSFGDDLLLDDSFLDSAFLASIQGFNFEQGALKTDCTPGSGSLLFPADSTAIPMEFLEPSVGQNIGLLNPHARGSFAGPPPGLATTAQNSRPLFPPLIQEGSGSPLLDSSSSMTLSSSPAVVPSPPSSDAYSDSSSPSQDVYALNLSSASVHAASLNQRDQLGSTALSWAVAMGNPEIVGSLLQAGADPNVPNSKAQAPLHLACLENAGIAVVELLIQKGANVNCLDGDRCTPLSYASRSGRADIVSVLLAAGADPSIADSQDMTPIMHAVAQGRSNVVAHLVAADPTAVSARDRSGWTALHWAVAVGSVESTLALLRLQRVNVAQGSLKEETPLHLAARAGNVKIMRLLLAKIVANKQASVLSSLTDSGMSALSFAEQKGHVEMIMLIQHVLSAAPLSESSESPSASQESELDDALPCSGISVPQMRPMRKSPPAEKKSSPSSSSSRAEKDSSKDTSSKASKRSHDEALEDMGSGDEDRSETKKERRRNYMRQRRNEERDQIQCMEDKVSALEQENKRLTTQTSALRAEADRIRALLNGEAGHQRFPPSNGGWGESFV